jgi:hypothetical protein
VLKLNMSAGRGKEVFEVVWKRIRVRGKKVASGSAG